jgi:hypothetical protein
LEVWAGRGKGLPQLGQKIRYAMLDRRRRGLLLAAPGQREQASEQEHHYPVCSLHKFRIINYLWS